MRLVRPIRWNARRSPWSAGRPSSGARDISRGAPGPERDGVDDVAVALAHAPRDPRLRDGDGVGAGRRHAHAEAVAGRRLHLDRRAGGHGEPALAERRVGAAQAGLLAVRTSTPASPASCQAISAPSTLGSLALVASRCGHQATSATAHAVSATASTARSERRIRGRSAIAACRRAAAGRSEHDDGQQPPGAEGEADRQPERGIAERDADAGQRPDREGEDERREAEPEQHAVEPGGQRHRQRRRHDSGTWRRTCGHDPRAARLADRRRQRDRGRRDRGARAERLAEQREAAEGDRAAHQRADREGRARGDGHPHPPGVALRGERLHHREAARGPGAGDAGRRRGEDEHGL